MSMIGKIEYRIRPITRYVVTRYEETIGVPGGKSIEIGTYPGGDIAYEVGYALAKAEHERYGFPPGDDRIVYPQEIADASKI